MTPEKFEVVLSNALYRTQKILASKGKEYGSEDRLHNFKRAGEADGITPEQALWGMFLKHYISIRDLVKGNQPLTEKMISEKIGDGINYFILLEALFIEKLEEAKAKEQAEAKELAPVPDIDKRTSEMIKEMGL